MPSRSRTAIEWLAGVAVVAFIAVAGWYLLRAAARTRELRVEGAGNSPYVPAAGLPDAYLASPGRVRERLSVHVDGRALPVRTSDAAAGDDGERFVLETDVGEPLQPGFHLLEFRPGYGQPEPWAAALGLLAGPFGPAAGWCERGIRVAVSQEALDRLEAPLARLVEQGLAARLAEHGGKAPREVKAAFDLAWSARGLDLRGEVSVDRTRARLAAALEMFVDPDHRVRLRRIGEIESSVEGKLVHRGRFAAAGAGAGAGALAGPWGALAGAVAGLVTGDRLIEKKARGALTRLVDERLADLETSLASRTGVPLGEGKEALLEIRPSGTPSFVPGRLFRLDFDVRVRVPRPAPERAAAPGPLLDGLIPPPPTPGRAHPLAVTVSVDAFNRVLHGLWLSGRFDRMVNDPVLLKRVRQGLEQTVFEVEGIQAVTPPVVARASGAAGLSVAMPRLEVALRERGCPPGRRQLALFAATAAVTAEVDAGEAALRFRMSSPRLWGSCRAAGTGGDAYYPCLSELLNLGRSRLDQVSGRGRPLLSLPTRTLLPIGGGDGGNAFVFRLANLDVTLPRLDATGSGVVVRLDPRVD